MIKLKDLITERFDKWDATSNKYSIGMPNIGADLMIPKENEKRGEAAFYGMLIKLVKKSKFYPHAGKNEVELHGKIVFTKAFDEVRNKRVNLKKYEYDYKGWPKHVKEFIENMEMFK